MFFQRKCLYFRKKTWRVPFILTVDGKITDPPALNKTNFESTLNFTAVNGQSYHLISDKGKVEGSKVFSANINHKVPETDYEKMKEAIIIAWCTEHPG